MPKRERDDRDREDDRDDRRGGGKSGGGDFKYRGRSSESVSRRAKQSSGAYDSYFTNDVISYRPRDGENHIRILPWNLLSGKEGDELAEKYGDHWGIDLHVHYNVGPDENSYLCLEKMRGEPCPVCEARAAGTEEEADALRISTRIVCWVIDRKEEKAGPKIWAMPLGMSNDISNASQVKGSGDVLLIDDPDEGYDIFFEKQGEKKRTKYKQVEADRDWSPISEDSKKQERWLSYVADHLLPETLVYFEADHIEKVLFGQGTPRGKDDDDGGRGSRRSRGDDEKETARPSRRGAADDADEETTTSRRSRRGEPEEERDTGRRRRGGDDDEKEKEKDAPAERSSRRSRRDDPPEEEETSQDHDHEAEEAAQSAKRDKERGKGGGQERYRGKDADEEAPRERRRGRGDAEEDEPKGDREERTSDRRKPREEPSDGDASEEDGARGRLERLSERRRR